MSDPHIMQLAKILKSLEKKDNPRWFIGTIICLNPLTIKTPNFELTEDDLDMIVTPSEINKEVILIPSSNFQRFLLIGEKV